MKYFIIRCGIAFLNIIYFSIKLFPIQKNKITFMSRQADNIPLDFKMILEELKSENKNLNTVVLCKELKN